MAKMAFKIIGTHELIHIYETKEYNLYKLKMYKKTKASKQEVSSFN